MQIGQDKFCKELQTALQFDNILLSRKVYLCIMSYIRGVPKFLFLLCHD